MTRTVTTAAVILLLTAALGCQSVDTGTSQRLPRRTNLYAVSPDQPPLASPSSAGEIDLVEQMTSHRRAYRHSLESLIQHYDAAGNHEKLTWAREELRSLDRIPQYRYIIEAQVMPASLRATEIVPAADALYEEARRIHREAGVLPVLKDEEVLRAALGKYADLIRLYPSNDKIDDSAYHMGEIHEYFNDFSIALQYYQRAYQWDPTTPYPARYKAASILDRRLHRRAEALELYQEALVKEPQFDDWRITAERRIRDLASSDRP